MKNKTALSKILNTTNFCEYESIDGLLCSIDKPNYSVQAYYNGNDSLDFKAVLFKGGILGIYSSLINEKPCYGLILGEIKSDLNDGDLYSYLAGEIIKYGEQLQSTVFEKGITHETIQTYFKNLEDIKDRHEFFDFESNFFDENIYIGLDVIEFVMQNEEYLDTLIAIIVTKMLEFDGDVLFALAGESGRYKHTIKNVRKMFVDFFKNLNEKYLPMIQI